MFTEPIHAPIPSFVLHIVTTRVLHFPQPSSSSKIFQKPSKTAVLSVESTEPVRYVPHPQSSQTPALTLEVSSAGGKSCRKLFVPSVIFTGCVFCLPSNLPLSPRFSYSCAKTCKKTRVRRIFGDMRRIQSTQRICETSGDNKKLANAPLYSIWAATASSRCCSSRKRRAVPSMRAEMSV